MPITAHPVRSICQLLLVWVVLLLVACAQRPLPESPYIDPGQESDSTRQSAVDVLQSEASTALRNDDFALAIETLQRAIRIEPRNAYSWHYLGLTYLELGDLSRCRAMASRSVGFSAANRPLQQANERLLKQCEDD